MEIDVLKLHWIDSYLNLRKPFNIDTSLMPYNYSTESLMIQFWTSSNACAVTLKQFAMNIFDKFC